MTQQAKIFLSEERGITELDSFRSYHTFNFGNYFHPYKKLVDGLYVLNDDTLAGGKSINLEIEHTSLLILLPVVGAVEYRDSMGNSNLVRPGELHTVLLPAASSYTVTNIFTSELVNFIQLWIQLEEDLAEGKMQLFSFNLDHPKSRFSSFNLHGSICFHIAKFAGRKKSVIPFGVHTKAAFCFVIEGAFELEERLLHARDGLALWNSSQADMEALSNDAIIFLLEL